MMARKQALPVWSLRRTAPVFLGAIDRFDLPIIGDHGPMRAQDELTAWLDTTLETLDIAGVAVGVQHAGRTTLHCRGVSDRRTQRPVTADTMFQVASATKPFTATAVLRLHEQGQLDLDLPVLTYLPDLRLGDEAATGALTTRHLLTHTGGFEGDDSPIQEWGADVLDRSLVELATLPQIFEPGKAMSYSNSGFRLLGILAQRISGLPYDQLIRETVLEPLQMNSSHFLPWEVVGRDVALGHGTADGGLDPGHTPNGVPSSRREASSRRSPT